MNIDPVHYGYRLNDEGQLQPIIVNGDMLPHDLPQPCKCVKCAKSNVCICLINEVNCCEYYNCKTDSCQNPKKAQSINQPKVESTDVLFAEMIGNILEDIANSQGKDILKIEIQRMLYATKENVIFP